MFLQDYQTIANMATSAPSDKNHHKVSLRSRHNTSKNERPRYLYHLANYHSMKLELQRVGWYEVFYDSSSTACLERIKEIINNFKICPVTKVDSQKKNHIYMEEQTVIKN